MDQTNPPSSKDSVQNGTSLQTPNENQASNVLPKVPLNQPPQSPQPTQPPLPSSQPTSDTTQPPSTTPHPHPKFKIKKRYILLTTLISLIVIIITLQELNKKQVEEVDQNPPFSITQAPTPTPEEEPARQWKSFSASQHGITFKYPIESYLEKSNPFSQDSPVYKAIFRGKRQDEGLITESNLLDGYIFKITVNTNPQNRPLIDLANNKKSSFAFSCPDLAQISDVKSAKIDDLAAQTFSVINCNSDFKVTFVVSKNFVYEIDQIYKGDIGFKQKYEKDTDEILFSLKVDRELPPPEEPIIAFENKEHGFSFRHPRFNTNCCQVPAPVYGEFSNTAKFYFVDTSLGVPEKNKPFDGFGIFVDTNKDKITFETYLESEKTALLEDYKVITGRNPEESQEIIKVGEVDAILLKGYAWWGDVIMLQVPNTSRIMIISKTEYLPGSFKDVFNDILRSFVFTAKVAGASDESEPM
ncbi:hypothetical protein A3F07_01635 [candidate division WWE3 bacterium RIFCSPHIGHO2_12_FULL_38_15]|uniref:Uncharacterized protein n=1 Tax=candidate division WWE3 bacterium RIFCSPHIGHO2_02_FULL_38_14 TaxID=1802620 RepID=A0A1F4V8Y3_UNCKA|nr:MAG: hypothetical protein A2793_01665 [candidate division WWE3 bacterium RIFCSPHIGHO2_01_FULL_38_45]OGC48406.1 MAG: hypothetical protein A3F07_01635 [candidate division WWE3 bacterium RIFCSPHIGHO2_12_FULL_38_15]OGC53619.1 MAG: hypothetical protein A3D91_04220 [candidate division WWE3 bacterium RIFCSPHIGHO2_02_FULL_38_14]OGC54339.1 MAG: hypothetical protein A3B64_02430 [candidate division WWE3 bacterium RIFCSPLOWO2_01_FULL_37_24]HLB51584.1 hypothetical protein [Patescibacteria group bacterium